MTVRPRYVSDPRPYDLADDLIRHIAERDETIRKLTERAEAAERGGWL